MNSIFTVVAHFEDWDSTWFVNIGHFTSKDEAQSVKSKWETFFIKAEDVFLESENWNPKNDPYYDHPFYTPDEVEFGLPGTQKFEWRDSKAYEDILTKFESIRHLKGITIEEFPVNKDFFMDSPFFNGKKDLLKLMKCHNREWSINKIIE
jgi:hypothetical protein